MRSGWCAPGAGTSGCEVGGWRFALGSAPVSLSGQGRPRQPHGRRGAGNGVHLEDRMASTPGSLGGLGDDEEKTVNFKDDNSSDEWRAVPDGNGHAGWMSGTRGSIPVSQ